MQGRNNTVNCTQASPPQIGRIGVSAFNEDAAFLFDGQPADLPIPPQFPKDRAPWHCGDWRSWLLADPRIYTTAPGGYLFAVSGKGEQVDIVDYRVELYARKKLTISKATLIVCSHGGGANAGYLLDWNTVTQQATLTDLTKAKPLPRPIPPASIAVVGPRTDGIALSITSNPNCLYSGRLVLTAIINGKKETVLIGNEDNPHRWVDDDPTFYSDDEWWDWNPVSRRWVKGLDPFSI